MKYQSDYETIESLKELKDTIDGLQAECQNRLTSAQQLQFEAQAIQAQFNSINSIGEFIESVGGRIEFLTLVQTLDQVIEPLKTFQVQNQTLLNSIQDILSLFAVLNSGQSPEVNQENSDNGLDFAEEDIVETKGVSLLSSLSNLGLASTAIDVQKEFQAAREVSIQLEENRIALSNKLDSLSTEFEKLEPQIQSATEKLTQKSAVNESLYHKLEDISRRIESDRNEIESAIQAGQNNVELIKQHTLSAEKIISEAKDYNQQVKTLYQEFQNLFLELEKVSQENRALSNNLEENLKKSHENVAFTKNNSDTALKIYDQVKKIQQEIKQDKDAIDRDRQETLNSNLNFSKMEKDLKELRTQYSYLDKKNQKFQKRVLCLYVGFSLLFILFLIAAI